MIEGKVCPFMSRPSVAYVNDDGIAKFQFAPVDCQKERCMAWGNTQMYDRTGAKTDPNPGCRLIP